jgi:hypothetical protein
VLNKAWRGVRQIADGSRSENDHPLLSSIRA